MTETPDVSADVVERLVNLWDEAATQSFKERSDNGEGYRDLLHGSNSDGMRALVAHLRAHPEDAAAVLDGEVETFGRPRVCWRVVTPWRDIQPSEENA